jgi:hypothetical protein
MVCHLCYQPGPAGHSIRGLIRVSTACMYSQWWQQGGPSAPTISHVVLRPPAGRPCRQFTIHAGPPHAVCWQVWCRFAVCVPSQRHQAGR